jgi:hypothetical protein
MQLGGGIDLAAEDHLLGLHGADLAGEEAERPHAGEEAEQAFRQAELGAALGDDEIVGQRTFETAAQRIALDQGDRDDGQVHLDRAEVLRLDAGAGVFLQHDAILVPNQIGEEAQIATQVEDAGHA